MLQSNINRARRAAHPANSRPAPAPARAERVWHVELRAAGGLRLFLDELDYAQAQAAALEALDLAGVVVLGYCLLPDRLVLVVAGHPTRASASLAQLRARLDTGFRLRHWRAPPPCRIAIKAVSSARALARLCSRVRHLPVALGLADSPRAWGWVGPDLPGVA